MTDDEVKAKLADVIERSAELAEDEQISSRDMAERVLNTELDLMWELKKTWALERLTFMVNRQLQRKKEREGRQRRSGGVHPDPTFQELPETIFLRNRTRPKLDWCRLGETEEHLELLRSARRKNRTRIAQMEAVVDVHRRWAEIKRGVLWCDALDMEVRSILSRVV